MSHSGPHIEPPAGSASSRPARAAQEWSRYRDRCTVLDVAALRQGRWAPLEPATPRFSPPPAAAVLTAVIAVLLCVWAAPAGAASGLSPDGSPGHGGLQPDPSGGHGTAATPVTPVTPVTRAPVRVTPRVTVVKVAPHHTPARRHARVVHRPKPAAPVSAPPRSAPSPVFDTLRVGVPLPGRTASSGGLDSHLLLLAASALLLLVVLGGSLLGLALTQIRSARGV